MTLVNTCTFSGHWAQHQLIMTNRVNVCQALQHNDISLLVIMKAKDNEAGPGSNGRLIAVPAEDRKNLDAEFTNVEYSDGVSLQRKPPSLGSVGWYAGSLAARRKAAVSCPCM